MNDEICLRCGGLLQISEGWTPSYYNPDNANFERVAETFCPKCEKTVDETEILVTIEEES